MKNNPWKRVLWWTGVAFLVICVGCAKQAPKPETPVPSAVPAPQPAPPPTPAPPAVPPVTPRQPAAPLPGPPAKVEPTEKMTYLVHTVKWSGETVSIIAGWYTGDIENWKALAEANPNINPNRIYEGNKILIPEKLLKTRDPMTKEFVEKFYPKPKPKPAPSKPAPSQPKDKEEELDLFGPKTSPSK